MKQEPVQNNKQSQKFDPASLLAPDAITPKAPPVIEFKPDADFALAQFHDEMLAVGCKPVHVEQDAGGKVKLTFTTDEEMAGCKERIKNLRSSHKARPAPVPPDRKKLREALVAARAGTAEFDEAVRAILLAHF